MEMLMPKREKELILKILRIAKIDRIEELSTDVTLAFIDLINDERAKERTLAIRYTARKFRRYVISIKKDVIESNLGDESVKDGVEGFVECTNDLIDLLNQVLLNIKKDEHKQRQKSKES